MKVDEDAKAHVLRADGLVDDISFAAPASGGIHPNAESDGVDAMFLEDLQTILLGAGFVIEQSSLRFHL
jgi:hypothetical protein